MVCSLRYVLCLSKLVHPFKHGGFSTNGAWLVWCELCRLSIRTQCAFSISFKLVAFSLNELEAAVLG